ncbi:MAG: radical SAM protein [Clostridia bacterium]|nr:radical SAM protein [Clostridia bacterium]
MIDRRLKKAYVEITNRCNKSCSFCHGTKRVPRDMTAEEFARVLNELQGVTEYIYLHVLGEPLCHPRIIEFIKTATERGFKVSVTTNGTLLTDSLLDSGVYKVQISLHSFEEDDERAHREYLEGVFDFSQRASKKGILVSLRLWNLNSEASNSLVEGMLEERFPKPWRVGRDNSFTLESNLFLNYANRFEWPDINAHDNGERLFCYGLRDQIGILADGTVVPCCLDAEGDIPLGNVYTTSMADIMSSPRAKAVYDGFSKRQATEELCRKCSYAKKFHK